MNSDELDAMTPAPASETAVMVLLVDDQVLVGEAIRRALLDEPEVAFHYCGDPLAALTVTKEIKPTVILQDLLMPGVSGLDLVRQYRADPATSAIPIIVLSTKEEPKTKSDAFKAGANDYLVKLPDRIELIARIRYHSKAYVAQLQRDEAYRALRESQQKLLEKNFELQSLSNVDGLTGLSNRRFFDEYMEAEWKRGTRSKNPLSVLMIDVDQFKPFNDTYGHVAGDEVLKRIADAIKQSCRRSTDLAARYGGEEFAVILPDTPFGDLGRLGDKLCKTVEALLLPHSASMVGQYVTVSVGGATAVPGQEEYFITLVDAADKALYEAKHGGRNRAVTRDVGSLSSTQPAA
jgi:two-component system, chemotaxis family, response regulator WspR